MSTGSDLISYRLLKAAGPGIVGPLTTLFNLSLKRHEVPNEWKHSVVCPIFKGGRKDRRVPTNYRPISLTSCVARLMEKIINVQVLDYLQSHSLLYKHQSGFLPTHSTVTQLIYLSNKWQMALEKGNHVQTAFLDLSKAYDRVSIPGLLFKLSALGFSTESLKWFSSFLQDRTQCVRVNGSLSSVEYLKSGIPQGTVLGPVLFLIFINDLPSVVGNESSIFADDTTMFTFGEDLAYSCRSLTLDLNAASHWAKVWGMLYNAEKASTWPSGVSIFVFRPRLFRWVVWQYHKLTITSTSASILTKASLGQTTSTKFFHRVLGESACYDACEGYCQTLLFEEFTLALFDPSSNTRVLSGVEVRSQSWWSCKNRSAAAIMLCFRLWKNDLTTIRSSYFTRLSQIWPPPIWLSCCHHHRTTLDIPLEKNCTLSLLLKNRPPSLVFCHARLFFGIAYRQNCRRAPLLARLSQL